MVRLARPFPIRLWRSIAWALGTNRPDPEDLRAWIVLLLAAAPDGAGDELGRLLLESRPGDDDQVAVSLFDWLTEPTPKVIVTMVVALCPNPSAQTNFSLVFLDFTFALSVHFPPITFTDF